MIFVQRKCACAVGADVLETIALEPNLDTSMIRLAFERNNTGQQATCLISQWRIDIVGVGAIQIRRTGRNNQRNYS